MKSHIRTRAITHPAIVFKTEPDIGNLYYPLRTILDEYTPARHIKSIDSKNWEGVMFLIKKYKLVVTKRDNPNKEKLFSNCFNQPGPVEGRLLFAADVALIEQLFKHTLAFEFKPYSNYVVITITSPEDTISVAVGLGESLRKARARRLSKRSLEPEDVVSQTPTITKYPKKYAGFIWYVDWCYEFDDDIDAIEPLNLLEFKMLQDTGIEGKIECANIINIYTAGVLRVLRKHIWVKKMKKTDEDFCKALGIDSDGLKNLDAGRGTIKDMTIACNIMRLLPKDPLNLAVCLFEYRWGLIAVENK